MFSLHVKATMMKVSHPIVFGHCVKVFYKDAFAKHQEVLDELGVNVNNGMVDLYNKIESLPSFQREQIIQDIHDVHEHRPELAMVDSAKGHHQLPLAQRRDRGRLDARDDPARRQDVRRRRADQGHQGGQPRVHVLPDLPGDDQLV